MTCLTSSALLARLQTASQPRLASSDADSPCSVTSLTPTTDKHQHECPRIVCVEIYFILPLGSYERLSTSWIHAVKRCPIPTTPTSASVCMSLSLPSLYAGQHTRLALLIYGLQLTPRGHRGLLSPTTHSHHPPPQQLRPVTLLRPPRHDERHLRLREYPGATEIPRRHCMLPGARFIPLRSRSAGRSAGGRSVVLFYYHVSPISSFTPAWPL